MLIVLWARSYQQCEYLSHIQSGNRLTILGSNAGRAYLLRKTFPGKFNPPLSLGWKYNVAAVNPTLNHLQRGETFARVSYTLPVAIVVIGACTPWLPWSRQFGLRTLLIATALVAAVLWLAVALP
jgi:hypothetical protein